MMNFDGKEVATAFKEAFGIDISEATPQQLWFLVKISKHVRGRCKSNVAFNNYMNRNFSPARFKEVPKEFQGRTYKGLEIVVKDVTTSGEEGDE